ncbi:T9SS type A sorting domain-containing protein [Cesiribacter andamanensis]|uniref:Secretion system C-terminal sorting domain-containing protein n=1 Tax=Cesiribacter andamanensis AMV16 TaxID=1279009 RepID=M7NWT0_9BACT|nr:T9SS type A sorting domain-containing protein [Cesiribacter andamanensis]EMR02909.1 hypothetical protein ADICEAN_01947 [Cesiribacter andamanensis AMV16]
MASLSPSLFQHIRNKQHKLACRLLKAFQNGSFSELSSQSQWRRVKRLRRLEKRLGMGSATELKHWAIAAALGLISFTAPAQTKEGRRQPLQGKEPYRLEQARQLLNKRSTKQPALQQSSSRLTEGELGFVKGQNVGDPAIDRLVFADLDGDGDTDFVQVGYYSFHQVFLNDGQGNFAKGQVLSQEEFGFTYSILAADLDGDGDVDLLGTSYDNGTFVFKNDGNGTFSPHAFGTSVMGTSGGIADLDGDGDLDVVMAADDESGNSSVSAFLNNGNASFSAPRVLMDADISELLLTDVNGDDAPDLLLLSWGYEESVQVLLNDGAANFTSGSSLNVSTTNSYYPTIGAADVDLDGDQDLILFTSDGLHLFTNNGQGTFSDGGSIATGYGSDENFEVGDFTGDGYPDLIIGGLNTENSMETDGGVILAINDGSGNFQPQALEGTVPGLIDKVQLADLNTDGTLDVVVTAYDGATAYRNNGTGTFTNSGTLPIYPSASLNAVFADLDGDGDIDAITDGATAVWLNQEGEFGPGDRLYQESGFSRSLDVADINGDGSPDLVTSTYVRDLGHVFLNDGTGNFTHHITLERPDGFQDAFYVRFGDMDSDGDQDIITVSSRYTFISDTEPSLLQTWLNNGSGTFTEGPAVTFNGTIENLQIVDVNSDGKQDVVAIGNSQLFVFINQENGTLSAPNKTSSPLPASELFSIAQGDVDGDGKPDLVITDVENDAVLLFRNDGAGSFSPTNLQLDTYYMFNVSLGDVDGDGDLDLAVVSILDGTSIWLNNGSGTFDEPYRLDNLFLGIFAALIDTDGDQDLDLWWSGYHQPVQIWNNTLNSPATEPPTGLEDVVMAGISLYPNPTRKSVQVKWAAHQLGSSWWVEVISTSGRCLLQQTVQAQEVSPPLDISSLAPGLYLLRLSNGSSSYMHRIIKQ